MKARGLGRRWKKGELVWDELIPWIIGVVVLIIVLFIYFILNGKLEEIGAYLKQVLRLGK